MNPLIKKKFIVCLVVLGFMSLPKARAEQLSYGIKIAGATSFMLPTGDDKELRKSLGVRTIAWNPWFGAALYLEYPFNDHIGLALELLYIRFNSLFRSSGTLFGTSIKVEKREFVDTIGWPVVLVWSWTTSIRPDFKEDYFHGRIFTGYGRFRRIKKSKLGKEEGPICCPRKRNKRPSMP